MVSWQLTPTPMHPITTQKAGEDPLHSTGFCCHIFKEAHCRQWTGIAGSLHHLSSGLLSTWKAEHVQAHGEWYLQKVRTLLCHSPHHVPMPLFISFLCNILLNKSQPKCFLEFWESFHLKKCRFIGVDQKDRQNSLGLVTGIYRGQSCRLSPQPVRINAISREMISERKLEETQFAFTVVLIDYLLMVRNPHIF